MNKHIGIILVSVLSVTALGQMDLQPLAEAQRRFERSAFENGARSAFLQFMRDDAVIFQPGPTNGKQYWDSHPEDPTRLFVRNLVYSDIAASGLLGYTTGNWRVFQKGKSEGHARFGQYVTIWERAPGGQFRISVDISISHEKMPFSQTDTPVRRKQSRDMNKRGWSPADASMNFFRASMSSQRLGGAYDKFAADEVRLLRDSAPPIIGKKHVVAEMNQYIAIEFPTKVTMFQSADMAYTWNPCQFDNSDEGKVEGNCLHIWKLRKKKWWIVLGVFAPVPNETVPVLKPRPRR